MKIGFLALSLSLSAAPLHAQATLPQALDAGAAQAATVTSAEVQHGTATPAEHAASPANAEGRAHELCGLHDPADFITPHITDSHCIELPADGWKIWLPREHALPRWAPIHIGSLTLDMSPTKHVVMLLVASLLACVVLIGAARAHVRATNASGSPTGFATGIESIVLYIRQEVALPNLGHHGEGYAPFILSLFFFILFANLLGLVPYGSTATGNVSVTATLAVVTAIIVELAGIRAQGAGYLNTIFYWNKDLPIAVRILMFFIMSPIEMIGKLTKPFALTIRLFANMTAGHIVVLALIGLIFAFKSYVIGLAPAATAVAIMMLELFVAFLQAFIFSMLASVFIGQMREAAH
jgi:F-type H+-transporting ATPase subunit a